VDLTPLFVLVVLVAVGLSVARLVRSREERDFLQGGVLHLISVLLGTGALAGLEPVWGVPLSGVAVLVGAGFLVSETERVEGVRLERMARTLEAVDGHPGEAEMALDERLHELERQPRFSPLSGLAAAVALAAVLAGLTYDLPLGYLVGGLTAWLPLQDWVRARTRDAERRSLETIRKGLAPSPPGDEELERLQKDPGPEAP
jgi:hypothetical protein